MSVILQSDLPYPACLRDDLVCGDHIDPHTVAMVADSVNVRNKVIPCIEVSNTNTLQVLGSMYYDFELADGASGYSLSIEFALSQSFGQNGFGQLGRCGLLQISAGVYSNPTNLQTLFSFYYNKAEYSTVTGQGVSIFDTKEVGDEYRIETINGTFDPSFFTQGKAVPAFIRVSLNYPLWVALVRANVDHPITGETFTNSAVYGLSLVQVAI